MKKDSGFTLLELAIAITIFGILMLSFSQLLRSEIHLFNSAIEKNTVEEKARTAMMRVLDEIRITPYTMYSADSEGNNDGVYKNDPASTKTVIINANPSSSVLADLQSDPSRVSQGIYYDWEQGKLWYCDKVKIYLIADQIYSFGIMPASADREHFIKIFLGVGDPAGDYYDLLTWARLY